MKVLSSFLFSIYLCVAVPPIPKFACLYIWAPSMCGLGCSKCMFWICYKVIVLVTHATDSLERRKTKTVTCFHIFILFYYVHLKCLTSLQHCIQQWILRTPISWINHAASSSCNYSDVTRFRNWYDYDTKACTPFSPCKQVAAKWDRGEGFSFRCYFWGNHRWKTKPPHLCESVSD